MSTPGYSKPSHQYGQSLPGDQGASAPVVGEALQAEEEPRCPYCQSDGSCESDCPSWGEL